ncbi:DUF1877 family protein [Mariniflexile sp. HMF6888]|uniref:DUF1877 family protein n=1 Tax=Mariniflexile sp. HMF6888 TaxID=3373086 RepID=UPI00379E3CE5
MGIVCELYRMSDSKIEELKKIESEVAEEFLDENFASIFGKYHKENDTVFSMDKGWDITRSLIKQKDDTKDKFLKILDSKYIESGKVKRVNELLCGISNDGIKEVCDRKLMAENQVYLAKRLENWNETNFWNYILPHLDTYKKAFKKASELNHGIVFHFN